MKTITSVILLATSINSLSISTAHGKAPCPNFSISCEASYPRDIQITGKPLLDAPDSAVESIWENNKLLSGNDIQCQAHLEIVGPKYEEYGGNKRINTIVVDEKLGICIKLQYSSIYHSPDVFTTNCFTSALDKKFVIFDVGRSPLVTCSIVSK